MTVLTSIRLKGWKSIREVEPALHLGPINVLIGPNGAGKSNFVSFFKMLNEMVGERLQEFVGVSGGAESLLHFGSKITPLMEANLEFETQGKRSAYYSRLVHAAGGTLIFAAEQLEFHRPGFAQPQQVNLGSGHRESMLRAAENNDTTARVIRGLLKRCRVYHFHDTSPTATPRQPCYIEANRHLYPDGGNLAAMLRLYQQAHPQVYRRIVSTVRKIAPMFDDFVLEPQRLNANTILLNWKQSAAPHADYLLGPHQLSDGTLRAIALMTLFLQPEDDMPDVIILDEPELGLHPHAVEIIAGLIRAVSLKKQVLLATQSTTFLDHFRPEEIIVADSPDGRSEFRRLAPEPLRDWLEDYSVGELWQKNVLGGGPVA